MTKTPAARLRFTLIFAAGLIGLAGAHPMPDIPVRANFQDGAMTIRVELDPRAYEDDPEEEGYYMKWYYDRMTPEEKAEMTDLATPFINERVQFIFEPSGQVSPEFEWGFAMLGDKEMVELGDPMVMIGEWRPKPPPGTTGYRIVATEAGKLAVNFLNFVDGEQLERYAVLFPGEESFTLDVGPLIATNAAPEAGGASEADPIEIDEEKRNVALIGVISVAVIAGVIVAAVVLMRRPKAV